MKKIIISLFLMVVILIAGTNIVKASMIDYQNNNASYQKNSDIVYSLQDIYTSQNIKNQNQINCSKVTDSQFEKLGDAYMGVGITQEQHDAMENMMGGEGSDTLKQAHIAMGRAYIGCWANYNSVVPAMSMMSGYGFDYPVNFVGKFGMMGGYYGGFNFIVWCTMFLVWTLLVLGIISLIKSIKSKS